MRSQNKCRGCDQRHLPEEMKQAGELFFVIVTTVFFCAALTFLFLQAATLSHSYQSVKKVISGSEIFYEAQKTDTEDVLSEEETRGEELAVILASGLICDIAIDGRVFDKDSFDYETFDFSSLGKVYKKQYQYDKEGRICRILYVKKEAP